LETRPLDDGAKEELRNKGKVMERGDGGGGCLIGQKGTGERS